MSYIGYPQPPRALTSADIDEGAVTLADISFTDTPSNLNLNGNYNDQTMRLAHNTTVTGDVTLNNSKDFTVSSSSGLLVSSASHNLSNDDQIYVQTSATLPTGLSANTNYYVISKTDDTFKLSTTRGGSAIAYTNAGSGTHTWYKNVNLILAKVADDGNPVTLTNDGGTRTLSGIGSIETSTLSSRPNSLVTGMTGELGSGVTGGSGINALGTVTSGTIGSGVTIDNTHEGVQHPFNATSWPAFAVGNADADTVTNVDTTWRKVEWNHSSGTNATSGSTSYVADHLFNIGGFFDLNNDWFLPTVAGYYCFSYYTNVHNVGADRRYDVRFYRSADATGDWYDQFFTAGEQTSTSEQTNFGFTTGPVYMNGTTHRVFIMHKIHSGSYGFNKGSHQQGFRGWRVG